MATKTTRSRIQFFNRLPEEAKHQAIINYEAHCDKISVPVDYTCKPYDSLDHCLSSSFVFEETAQGQDYWTGVVLKYNK